MADYSEIPKGIARKIAVEHLDNLEDVETFGEVCSLWRSETKDINHTNFRPSTNTQLPWLMLPDSPTNNSYGRFYSLSKRMVRKIDLPNKFHDDDDDDDEDHIRYFSSKGWLIGVSRKHAVITFYDPFSGTVIKPPNLPKSRLLYGDFAWTKRSYLYQFSKFVFSCCGGGNGGESDDDFQVAVIYNSYKHLAIWRPGQQHWIQPETYFLASAIQDVCFLKGEWYGIDNYALVYAFGSGVTKRRQPRIILQNLLDSLSLPLSYPAGSRFYMIALSDTTLLIVHKMVSRDNRRYTQSFQLFELNVENGKATIIHSIGNRALFIGFSSTFFVEAAHEKDQRGCIPDCIYFTDDHDNYYKKNVKHQKRRDMGVYSLKEGKIMVDQLYDGPSQYNHVIPPIWVELPHH